MANLHIGIINPGFHKVVGEPRSDFLSTLCQTGLGYPCKAALDDLLKDRSLRYRHLAENDGKGSEEPPNGGGLGQADNPAPPLCRKLVFFGNLHPGVKLTPDTLGTLLRSNGCTLPSSGGRSGHPCKLCPRPQTPDDLRCTKTRHKE